MIELAKTKKDNENLHKLRSLLGEERDRANKSKQKAQDKAILKEVKEQNKERAVKGQEPVYIKKRELKERRHRDKFEKLDREGKLEDFIKKK